MKLITVAIVTSLGVILLSAATWRQRGPQVGDPSKDSKQQESRAGNAAEGAHKSYFELDETQRKIFISKLHQVHLGDTRHHIEALLGKPWSDNPATRKEDNKFRGRLVKYYIKKIDKNLVNERSDQFVLLRFDSHDQLKSITSKIF